MPDAAAVTEAAADASAEALEQGRLLFAKECRFITGARTREQLPPATLPELAFAGRSNVGKSSLVNALTGRKTLARTSNTPGRTREINIFLLDDRLRLVDLPGYGYAKAPKVEAKQWSRLVMDYLRGRPTLRRVCLLIDARHGLKPADEAPMAAMDAAAVSYQVVLTKTDKLKPGELEARRSAVADALAKRPAAHPAVLSTSATAGTGIPELRAAIAALLYGHLGR